MTKRINRLEIKGPVAECGRCHFSQPLDGEWSVRGGVLVWTAKRDPLTGRGPDYGSCCESDHDGEGSAKFDIIETDGAALPGKQQELLRYTAEASHWPGRHPNEYL